MADETRKQRHEAELEQRIASFRYRCDTLVAQGYVAREETVSILRANVIALVTAGPFVLIVIIVAIASSDGFGEVTFSAGGLFAFLGLMLLSIPVHEGLHGLTWLFFAPHHAATIRFGVLRDSLTPYCHCSEPLGYAGYILGGLMPFLVLGLSVSSMGVILHSPLLIPLGCFNILAAGGDTTIVGKLLPYTGKHALFLDHPTECGFIAFTREADC